MRFRKLSVNLTTLLRGIYLLFFLFCVWEGSGHGAFSADVIPAPEGIPVISNEQFKELDKSRVPVVLDFWANWCAPCQVYSHELSRASRLFGNKIMFYRVDVSDFSNGQKVEQYSIDSLPTVLVIVNGKVVDRWEGLLKDQDLKEKLEQVLKTYSQNLH